MTTCLYYSRSTAILLLFMVTHRVQTLGIRIITLWILQILKAVLPLSKLLTVGYTASSVNGALG